MPRALILYLSLGGTTARVARHIAAGLEDQGFDVRLHDLHRTMRQRRASGWDSPDLLGVGSPTHYFRLPTLITDYLDLLPPLDGSSAFSFTLYGTYAGDAAAELSRRLAQRGANELAAFSCRGADRYGPYLRKGKLFSPGRPAAADLQAAEQFGAEVGARASDVAAARTDPPSAGDVPADAAPADAALGWVYRVERLLTGRTLANQVYSRLFRVDRDRCTGCGRCEKRCPTGNIVLDGEGRPAWGRHCLLCLYCELVCPEEAVSTPVSWPPFDLFVRHNVRVAAADPAIEHALVVHERGRTRRLEGEPPPSVTAAPQAGSPGDTPHEDGRRR